MPRRVPQPAAAGAPPTPVDLARVREVVREGDPHAGLIGILQRVQDEVGYLPEAVVEEVARLTGTPSSRLYGIITFYTQFTTEPRGRHHVCVCHGTACHVAGAPLITAALEEELGITAGQTRGDLAVSLAVVSCMGACSQAPVLRVGDETHGTMTPDTARQFARRLVATAGAGTPEGGRSEQG